MPFGPRNAYYLRISRNSVLPLYLYLDERHLDWMSDIILQHVLADLKPLIPLKLEEEPDENLGSGAGANAKKSSVDVYRGDAYQFAYFFRKVEPHSVLVKTRNFTLAPPKPPAPPQPIPQKSKKPSRATKPKPVPKANKARPRPVQKRTRTSRKAASSLDAEDHLVISSDDDDDDANDVDHQDTNSSKRRKPTRSQIDQGEQDYQPAESDDEVEVKMEDGIEDNATPALQTANLSIDEDEAEALAKPKPILQLSYQNFDLSGRCLCVIVEPWPPIVNLNRASRAPSAAASTRGLSIAPADFVSSEDLAARGRTPLFYPEDEDEPGQPAFRVPDFPQKRVVPPVPLFNDTVPEDENSALLQFSQTLNSRRGHGVVNDDDEFDGTVLFGDADEVREL